MLVTMSAKQKAQMIHRLHNAIIYFVHMYLRYSRRHSPWGI